MLERIAIATRAREELVDITREVQGVVDRSGVREGIAIVMSQHTTGGITINENADSDVKRDLLHWLRARIPRDWEWRHGEGNSDSHLKTSLFGPSQTIPIEGGRLCLGTWQGIFFAEFDGPRSRTAVVKVIAC